MMMRLWTSFRSSPVGSRIQPGIFRMAIVCVIAAIFFVFAVTLFLPLPRSVLYPAIGDPARILDRDGHELYAVRSANMGERTPLPYNKIPKTFVDAIIATEDRRFWSHPGIDVVGLGRAVWQNVSAGRIVSGASTITQQLVRIRRPRERGSVIAKLFEMRDALRMEMSLSKEDILAGYLNSAYFGHQAYGVESAARTYFAKNLSELSLSEHAMLAGLLQSPSSFDPYRFWDRAKRRQATVLQSMQDAGMITDTQRTEAEQEELTLGEDRVPIEAPHFVFWIRDKFPQLIVPGSRITTTLDLTLQRETQRIVDNALSKLTEQNVTSAAVVVLDAHTGDVLTMVGSADYFDTAHDGAVNVALSSRQPGSTLKPFTYALALAGGDTLASTVSDVEIRYFTQDGNPYTPRNYDYQEHGLVRYREALANSYNIAAVKVLERVGVERLMRLLTTAGITTLTQSPEHYGLALTLGDAEVTLLELTRAYGMFARGGETLSTRTLLDEPVLPGIQAIDPKIAWLISSALSDDDARLAQFGRGGPLSFERPVAVKTGTTRNARDNWTIAYTPDRVVGVWVGNADNAPMRNISGVTGAAPILHEVMLAATTHLPPTPFDKPSGIVDREICRLSGKLPTEACSERTREFFVSGTEPRTEDDIWKIVPLDRRNGLLAGPNCPDEFTEKRRYALFPPELRAWAASNGWALPPTRTSPLCPGAPQASRPDEDAFAIDWPHDGDAFELDPLVPDDRESITLTAHAGPDIETIEWFANGESIGTAAAPTFLLRWQPTEGRWNIEARAGTRTHAIDVTVTKKQ